MHSKKWINEVCEKLLEWASSQKIEDGIRINTWVYQNFRKSASYLHSLAQNHTEMAEALDLAVKLIADKIHNFSFSGKGNAIFGEKTLPLYDKEYKALKKEMLQAETEGKYTLADIAKMVKEGTLATLLSQDQEEKAVKNKTHEAKRVKRRLHERKTTTDKLKKPELLASMSKSKYTRARPRSKLNDPRPDRHIAETKYPPNRI